MKNSEINFKIDESVDIPFIKTKFTKKPHQIYHKMRLSKNDYTTKNSFYAQLLRKNK